MVEAKPEKPTAAMAAEGPDFSPGPSIAMSVPQPYGQRGATASSLPLPVRLCLQFIGGLATFTVLAGVTLAYGFGIQELEAFHATQFIVGIFRLVEYAALGTEVVCFLAFLLAEAKSFIVALMS